MSGVMAQPQHEGADLVGTSHRFGEIGPVYEVVGVAGLLRCLAIACCGMLLTSCSGGGPEDKDMVSAFNSNRTELERYTLVLVKEKACQSVKPADVPFITVNPSTVQEAYICRFEGRLSTGETRSMRQSFFLSQGKWYRVTAGGL